MTMEGSYAGPRPSGSLVPTRSEVIATHGMAATSQPLASQIALDVLKRGGTAVDAAIAANAALGLMEPTGNGVGGDLFAIVWDAKTRKLYGLNGSGRSPKSLTLDETASGAREARIRKPFRRTGPLPVSVPGAVDGWFELHGRFGKMPMKELLQPAISYARDGFPVTEVIAEGWARNARVLSKYPNFEKSTCRTAARRRKGEVFRNPQLARHVDAIADGGRDAFYKGDIARRIETYMRANGGYLTAADLAAHHSRVGRAGLDQLPWLRRLGAAAEHAGHRRAADAQHPRGVRSQGDGFRQRRIPAPVHRGEETRVRGPGAILRRSRSSRRFRSRDCCRRITPRSAAS